MVKAEDRVGQSRKSLEDAEETIREAKAAVSPFSHAIGTPLTRELQIIVLEGRMADEETTQEKIRVYNQLVLCTSLPAWSSNNTKEKTLSGFSCICVILPSVILAWWLARPESK